MAEETQKEQSAPQWQQDLDNAGLVRRLLISRKWYGADWWFVLFSAALLLFIVSMALFPGLYAPFDPRDEVSESLLAPGQLPRSYMLVSTTPDIRLIDLEGRDALIGSVRGDQGGQALRDAIEVYTDNREAAGEDTSELYLRPRPVRYDTLDEAIAGLINGETLAVVALSSDLEPIVEASDDLYTGERLGGADRGFVLGTNQIGQDVLSRVIWGTRIALIVGFSAALSSLFIGVPLGMIAGFFSGRLERVLTLVMDSLYSFPGLILAIAITAVLGPGLFNVIIAIAVLYIPTYYRIVRGQTMAVKEELYVEAAFSLGVPTPTLMLRYIFPNVIPSVFVIFSVNVADAILTEAGLSFLGLGLPPDTPDWGIDLAAGQDLLRTAWWLVTFPGLMIVVVVLGFSMLGESLSEILNPRLREN